MYRCNPLRVFNPMMSRANNRFSTHPAGRQRGHHRNIDHHDTTICAEFHALFYADQSQGALYEELLNSMTNKPIFNFNIFNLFIYNIGNFISRQSNCLCFLRNGHDS
jgi:hypothetical protein